MRLVAVAALSACVLAAAVPAALPATAASNAVSIKAATTLPYAGTHDLLSGSVTGPGVYRLQEQYYSGGWRNQASVAPSSGKYHFSLFRTNVGVVKYRVVATNRAGKTLATSAGLVLRWLGWQNIANAQNSQGNYSVCTYDCYRDETYSFNGTPYQHSLSLQSPASNNNPTQVKSQYDLHFGGICRALRYTLGFAAGAAANDMGRLEVLSDGNGVSSVPFGPSQGLAVTVNGLAGHDLISVISSADFYDNPDFTHQYAVVGTPQALCDGNI